MLGRDYILSQCPVSAGFPCRLHMNTGECWREYMVQPVRPGALVDTCRRCNGKPAANALGNYKVSGSNPDRALKSAIAQRLEQGFPNCLSPQAERSEEMSD